VPADPLGRVSSAAPLLSCSQACGGWRSADQRPASWSCSRHQIDLLATTEHLPHTWHSESHSPGPRPHPLQSLAQRKLLTHLLEELNPGRNRQCCPSSPGLALPSMMETSQPSQGEDLTACTLPAGTHRPCCPRWEDSSIASASNLPATAEEGA